MENSTCLTDQAEEIQFYLTDITLEQTNDNPNDKNRFLASQPMPQVLVFRGWHVAAKCFSFVRVSERECRVDGSIEIPVGVTAITVAANVGGGWDVPFVMDSVDINSMGGAAISLTSGQVKRTENYHEELQMTLSWAILAPSPTIGPVEDCEGEAYSSSRTAAGLSARDSFGSTEDIDPRLRLAAEVPPDIMEGFSTSFDYKANSSFTRFERSGDLSDIDQAIGACLHAVETTPYDHAKLPDRLANLGNTYTRRFQRKGDLSDIVEATAAYQLAVKLTPLGHDDLPSYLTGLGNTYLCLFERNGELPSIAEALTAHQRAVELTPDGHARLPARLTNLGNAFLSRSQCQGDPSDIDQALGAFHRAVNLTPDGDTDLPIHLTGLGTSFLSRFERNGDLSDIAEAVEAHRSAVDLTPDGNVDLPSRLANLGNSYVRRFERSGDITDVAEAVAAHQRAVELIPDGHADLPSYLTNLGNALLCRFERKGDLSDVNEAVAVYHRAVEISPAGHAKLPSRLVNLGNSYARRFERNGDLGDSDKAVAAHQSAVDLTPNGHAYLAFYLGNLGNSYAGRFDQTGNIFDIDEAVATYQRAIELTPDGHADLPIQLSNLGIAFLRRFQRNGDFPDITDAVAAFQYAIELTPDGHASLPIRLTNIGNACLCRFERNGDLSDVAEGIAAYQRAVRLIPDGHASLPTYFMNLGNSYMRRFERNGDLLDIEEAVAAHQRAVELTPDGHTDLPSVLMNLGNALVSRSQRKGDPDDLTEGIAIHQRAVKLTPDGHGRLPAQLANLGNLYMSCFERNDNPSDMAEAIAAYQNAVKLTPDGHADLPTYLSLFGNSLVSCFECNGDLPIITGAIEAHRMAVKLIPAGHARLPWHLYHLARSFHQRSIKTGSSEDVATSIDHFSLAANSNSGPASTRLEAAKQWATLSYEHYPNSPEILTAFETAVHLFSFNTGLEDTVQRRYARLLEISRFPLQAAAAACSLGRADKALEWLEQSRCIVWTQLNNLRTPLDSLRIRDKPLAQRLSDVSKALENAGSSRRPSTFEMSMTEKISAHDEVHAHLKLANEWDELISTVRAIPDFENFLRPSPCSILLQNLPESGPIVVINMHEDRCDAIMMGLGQEPHSLHLAEFSQKKADDYRQRLAATLKRYGLRMREVEEAVGGGNLGRAIKPMKGKREADDVVRTILESLWNEVVKPILDALGFTKVAADCKTPPPRIWWCPTGSLSFLPLHAAGIYRKDHSEGVLDYAVSSYTPTVTSLTDRVKDKRTIDTTVSGLFLTSQPDPPGAPSIPGATKEVASIYGRAVEHGVRSLKFEGGAVTVEECLKRMDEFSSIHLACHASQDANEPLKSRFLFHEGALELAAINQKNLKNADLAFLSACQTSTGEETLTDEAVHLAAGMLAAGYRRVVATMWAIGDQHAPKVAADFYDYLWNRRVEGSGSGFDGSFSAYALHHATQRLRQKLDNSQNSLLTWIPYVHFGF